MRIIAGTAKGRRIQTPKGMDVRPTTDRVREALFSVLTPHLREATVLDLFAGTGALGLEALSRGARSAMFVERSPTTVRLLRRNVETCNMNAQAQVLNREATAALRLLDRKSEGYDLIFLDPPYQGPMLERALKLLATSSLIHPDSLIIAEHPADRVPSLPADLSFVSTKQYGKTTLSFIRYIQNTTRTYTDSI